MALTLNPILAAAQDAQSRHPIVEIKSESATPDIPFDGTALAQESSHEPRPNQISHSSGRLCAVYKSATGAFTYLYTDPDRVQIYKKDISLPENYIAVEATLCELENGNIGFVLYGTYSGLEKLRSLVLSPDGSVVSAQQEIYSVATATKVLQGPFVVRLANNTYFLVYVDKTVSGGTFYIRNRTSSDFLTWSSENTCSIGGLTATKRIRNPWLRQITTGDLWLWFDYLDNISGTNEMINVYYSVSANNGATWANAVKFTNYTTYNESGEHPAAFQKAANQMHAVYTLVRGLISKTASSSDWPAYNAGGSKECEPLKLQFDPATRHLYAFSLEYYPTNDNYARIYVIVKINVDTWEVVKWWSNVTTPKIPDDWVAFPATQKYWFETAFFYRGRGAQLFLASHLGMRILHIDAENDTINEYRLSGAGKNVGVTTSCTSIEDVFYDPVSQRVYCLLYVSQTYPTLKFQVGYFSLTDQQAVKGWTDVVPETTKSGPDWWDVGGYGAKYNRSNTAGFGLLIIPEESICAILMGLRDPGTTYAHDDRNDGHLFLYALDGSGLIREYRHKTDPTFPCSGIPAGAKYANGKIYATYAYLPNDTHYPTSFFGFGALDLSSGLMTHYQPSWPFSGTYGWRMRDFVLSEDGNFAYVMMLYQAGGEGVGVLDLRDGTWARFTSSNVPGLPMVCGASIAVDDAKGMIFAGFNGYQAGGSQLVAFSKYGHLKTSVFRTGAFSGGSWTWGAPQNLVQGLSDYDLAPALKSSDIFAIWARKAVSTYILQWDKEGASLDLGPYLVRGREVLADWSIDGSPARLDFSVSHGHLFDPVNITSLLSIYLRKGRKITLRLGEKVNGENYWQKQGSFYVTERVIQYERRAYPVMEVKAEDLRHFWDEALIVATPFYQAQPKAILEDILQDYAGLSAQDMDIPVFQNSTQIDHQWIETSVKQIADQIAERFGYFLRVDVDGKVGARKISDQNPLNHVYSGLTQMIRFSPDDAYSRTVNRVIVTGKKKTPITVLFAEEPIGTVDGTVGWWGGTKRIEFWYSPDHSRRCLSPRLKVIVSVKNFGFRLGGGGEAITSVRSDLTGCTITISCPNLVPALVALLAAIVATAAACSFCDGWITGWCGACIVVLMTMISTMISIVASVASYQYEVYAQPYGYVYQTVQAIYNDEENQIYTGRIISQKIDDPLCYEVSHCQQVAAQEGLVARLDRSRVRLKKIAHLQDEVGDTIQVVHPISGLPLKIFITRLRRRLLIPERKSRGRAGDGYFLDEIEGWKL